MSLINLLPQKIEEELRSNSLLKVISGLNNFDAQSVKTIVEAAALGGADLVDIACKPELVDLVLKNSTLPVCVSSVVPQSFQDSVKAGASLIEIGNYDTFYEKGIHFSDKKVLNITKETRDLFPVSYTHLTLPTTGSV